MRKQKSLTQIRDAMMRRKLGGSGDIPWVKTFRDVNKCVGELLGSETTMMVMVFSELPPSELRKLIDKTVVSRLIRLLKVDDPVIPKPLFAITRNVSHEFSYVDEAMDKMRATYRVVTPETPEEPKNP